MKKAIYLFAIIFCFSMCTQQQENSNITDQPFDNPSDVQPVQDGITDSTTIMNDSVIMPESQQ